MVALTDVTLTAGVGTGGTGTVSTLDKFNGTAGSPTTQVLTVQGIASGTPAPVSGNVAAGAADSGNPVKIGAKYNATLPTLVDGNRGDLQTGTRGSLSTTLFVQDSTAAITGGAQADTASNAQIGLVTNSRGSVFNGTTWDRAPGGTTGAFQIIRDAAGNARGANVTAANEVNVIDTTITAQGTALGSTKTSLQGGSVTTASPSYTTGQISPLSLDTTGALRVNVTAGGAAGGTSSNFGAAFPSAGTAIGFSDGTNLTAGTIKAASTAAAAADKAIVVAISPNNYDFGSGTSGTKTQRVIIDSGQLSALGATTKSASTSVARATDDLLGFTVTQAASSTITRPADTTQYAIGDLVANSTTAGSVNNLQFTTLARISGSSGVIVGAQIQKSTNTTTNAAFRLHLFNTAPTYTSAGDNSAISTVVVASGKGYLGYIDITAMVGFSDVAWGSGAPDNSRGGIPFVATAQTIFALVEARGTYTPGNGEVFTITLDALQD